MSSFSAKTSADEAIFEQVKNLSELELTALLEKIHEHCVDNNMEHIFQPFYDDSYEVEELKNEVLVRDDEIRQLHFQINVLEDQLKDIACKCTAEEKHGWTTIKCCNHCGKSTEEFWTKKTEL